MNVYAYKLRKYLHPVSLTGLLLSAALISCGTASRYPKPFVSRDFNRQGLKMAILPFDNLSKTQGASKSMENYLLVEFLKQSSAKIIDPGEVSNALSKERIRLTTNISKENLLNIGNILGVDLVMLGIVHEYDMQSSTGTGASGNVPSIGFTLRIIDTRTGDIVWAVNTVRRGNDREAIFGIGRIQSLDILAEDMARELAGAFAHSISQ